MTPSEEWRPVIGYEGYYEVSDHGRVRSVPRTVVRVTDGARIHRRGVPLNPWPDAKGYQIANLKREGTQRVIRVHRLVAAAFIGPCPPGMEVCHNNGRPGDNRVENLRYDTHAGNVADRRDRGTMYSRRNERECLHGHSWDEPKSFYADPDGSKRCAVCIRAKAAAYRARKRLAC